MRNQFRKPTEFVESTRIEEQETIAMKAIGPQDEGRPAYITDATTRSVQAVRTIGQENLLAMLQAVSVSAGW